ncbi:hypothetical protein KM043_008416 [Ampulex compressa]|nr:hypothetical protein KM043_008416 [Ampulex compressa]
MLCAKEYRRTGRYRVFLTYKVQRPVYFPGVVEFQRRKGGPKGAIDAIRPFEWNGLVLAVGSCLQTAPNNGSIDFDTSDTSRYNERADKVRTNVPTNETRVGNEIAADGISAAKPGANYYLGVLRFFFPAERFHGPLVALSSVARSRCMKNGKG